MRSVLDNFQTKDQAKARAITYLRDWGDKFWIETEYRIKELTTKLASELSGEFSNLHFGKLGARAEVSEEQKRDIIHRGQAIINKVQVKELSEVVRFLNEDVFTDAQQPYFIVIDKLDENWVEDGLRYKLIRALIDTVRSFQRIQNVKVVVALRQDLLRKVFAETADPGFQEEKFEPLMLKLRWSKKQLEDLLDRRVAVLVQQPYTTNSIRFRKLFPDKIGRVPFIDYFVQRTALRPRDAILFVNDCLARSEAQGSVKQHSIYEAEREYSRLRKDSLIYEWGQIYPSLSYSIGILERTTPEFRISSLNKDAVDRVIEELASERGGSSDVCTRAATTYMNAVSASKNAVLAELFRVFFDVGLIGLKLDGSTGMVWSHDSTPPTAGQIKPNTKVQLHPMFYQALSTHFED